MAENIEVPPFILQRMGLQEARIALLEEQLAVSQAENRKLSDALALKGEGLPVDEAGVPTERLSEALEVVKDAETA